MIPSGSIQRAYSSIDQGIAQKIMQLSVGFVELPRAEPLWSAVADTNDASDTEVEPHSSSDEFSTINELLKF